MEWQVFADVGAGGADVERPATGEQSAGETLEPVDPAFEPAGGGRDAAMGEEREGVLVEEGVVDVEPAVDQQAIPQAAAGVHAQRPHAAAGAVVDGVRSIPPAWARWTNFVVSNGAAAVGEARFFAMGQSSRLSASTGRRLE